MKVGIVTIYDLKNYGNRLQNYATVKTLAKMNIEADTLILREYKFKNVIRVLLGKKRNVHWNARQELKGFYNQLSPTLKKRYEKFKDYSYKYTNIKKYHYNRFFPYNIDRKYDYFIAGSDQVWNPFIGHAYNFEFLAFAKKDKRISWSASFAVSELGKHTKRIKKQLSNMKHISVREYSGKEIVENLTDKKAEVLIDPTLMLSKEEWLEIAKKPDWLNDDDKYILTYILGEKNEKMKACIEKYSEENNLKVFELCDESMPKVASSSPEEFLYLFANASLILTDSFHACVFSFLFEKPFLIFAREGLKNDMISRIHTFLNMFHLERKFYDGDVENEVFEADYSEGYTQLEKERQKAKQFLENALNIEK